MKLSTPNCVVEFKDTAALRRKVFNAILNFYLDNESFDGESIIQNDVGTLEGPELLASIADDIFKFKVTWKEE
jgi:hypothetical protein